MEVIRNFQPTSSDRSPDTSTSKKRVAADGGTGESVSSSIVSLSEGEMIAVNLNSLGESSECSLDSLNQDLPPHMQLVPFSSKSGKNKQDNCEKGDATSTVVTPKSVGKVKSVIKNVCTPQAVPTPRKAENNYDMDELVESLPKLKVTTPARIHDERRGAFSMFSTPPAVTSPMISDADSTVINPVDIEPIFNPFENDCNSNVNGRIHVDDGIFSKPPPSSGSAKKSCGSSLWKNPFGIKSGLEKAGTILFKAQRSLFADVHASAAATENAGLSDSLLANVGSPAGIAFKGEQFSPNLSVLTTSPSNDSDSSFIMPSQNTDCDYLIRRISYDPTMDNMFNTSDRSSSNGSETSSSSYLSRVNVPSVIQELKESPDKVSPCKINTDIVNSNKTDFDVEMSGDKGIQPGVKTAEAMKINTQKFVSTTTQIPKLTNPSEKPPIFKLDNQTYKRKLKTSVVPPQPHSSSKPPWTPSGKVRYTSGPYSQIKLSQHSSPIRKIDFGSTTPVSVKAKCPGFTMVTPRSVNKSGTPGLTMVTPRSAGKGGPAVVKAKLPVYRRGTPHVQKTSNRGSPVSNKKLKTVPKFKLIDGNAPLSKKIEGTSERHEESLLLEEKRERLRQLREAKARLTAKMSSYSPIAGKKRPLSSPITLPPKRHPLVTMTGENSPRIRVADALSLGEKELEAVTQLHTLCNSQQAAKFVTKPRGGGSTRHTPSPKVASRLQWREDLIADLAGSDSSGGISAPSPARPILSERAPQQLFPYSDQPPSPVVIRRSCKKQTNPIAPSKLNFF